MKWAAIHALLLVAASALAQASVQMNVWYAPQARRFVIEEYEDSVGGRVYTRLRRELLEYQIGQ